MSTCLIGMQHLRSETQQVQIWMLECFLCIKSVRNSDRVSFECLLSICSITPPPPQDIFSWEELRLRADSLQGCIWIFKVLWNICSCKCFFYTIQCVCVCIYIYIYIYIIRVLVVTKSLCGYVSNQVQYNMDSAQYLG